MSKQKPHTDHELALKVAEECAKQGLITPEKLEEYRANHRKYSFIPPCEDKESDEWLNTAKETLRVVEQCTALGPVSEKTRNEYRGNVEKYRLSRRHGC